MKSMDIFDTLIGRWYFYPDSIFKEAESISKFPNFVWTRKHAESESKDKTFDSIYKEFKSISGASDEQVKKLKELEFELEVSRTFPIQRNVDRLDDKTVLVSDTYFDKHRLTKLLTKNGITTYNDIVCSYDGKSSGKVWNSFRSELHIGDNPESDYKIPRNHGIDSIHFESTLSPNEKWLEMHNFQHLAYLCRAVRLSNPFYGNNELFDVWNEQANTNLPILVLISNYLNSKYFGKKMLFTYRDCCNLYPIMMSIFPNTNGIPFYTSRLLYQNPTETFKEYTKEVSEDCIVIDLQGTGTSYFDYSGKNNYFTVINSDLLDRLSINYIFHRREGYSDKIEKINYMEFTTTTDVYKNANGKWIPENNKLNNKYIDCSRLAIKKSVEFIQKGFSLESHFDPNLLKDFLNYLEKNCVICKYVNHEEI